MHVKATFPSGHITIELLKTPVVDKWLAVFNRYKELNVPSVLYGQGICKWGGTWMKQIADSEEGKNARAEAVTKINDAIDNVNSCIQGTKFPYRAYEDMPWMHTNRIHRCFTTASTQWMHSDRYWQHNLTNEQLVKCKTMGTEEAKDYVYNNTTTQFKILDSKKFNWEISVINHQVHEYEENRHSIIAQETLKDLGWYESYTPLKDRRKNIMWNKNFTYTEDKTCLKPEFAGAELLETISYEEMLSSFPDNYEDYNVVVHKSITGKDYETCYSQYDDGMEVDIRNIEHINGNMTVHPDNDHYKFCTSTRFNNWAKNYGLRDEMFYNVPIGKIVDNTIDVSEEGKIESVELV